LVDTLSWGGSELCSCGFKSRLRHHISRTAISRRSCGPGRPSPREAMLRAPPSAVFPAGVLCGRGSEKKVLYSALLAVDRG